MLLDSRYTIIPSIVFSLVYDNGTRKTITVKTKDKVKCVYKKNGEKFSITGIVNKIGCNFNSSLGAVGTTAYMQIDGSCECKGRVEYVQPSHVLDLEILETTNILINAVCSVDPENQRITLIRENPAGVFQYSLDGMTWKAATGAQGMSAYECAVKLGFQGSEEEWLESLKAKCYTPVDINVEQDVGGYHIGDVIPAGTYVLDIITHMLSPGSPSIVNNVYIGVSATIPTSLAGLTPYEIDLQELIDHGIGYKFTANDQYLVYAYKKSIGELSSIKDRNGFENIQSWLRTTYMAGDDEYYIYYTDESKTICCFSLTFTY